MSLYIKGVSIVSDETMAMQKITGRKDLYFYYVVDKKLWEDTTPLIATGVPIKEGEYLEGEVEFSESNGISFLILVKTLERYKNAHKTRC